MCNYSCINGNTACNEYEPCEERKYIVKKINQKYRDNLLKDAEHNVPSIRCEDITSLYYSFLSGSRLCPYCGVEMKVRSELVGYPDVISIDHITSRSDGGDSRLSNLQMICHRCNIVKQHQAPGHFSFLVRVMREEFGCEGLEDFLNKQFTTNFANKANQYRKRG